MRLSLIFFIFFTISHQSVAQQDTVHLIYEATPEGNVIVENQPVFAFYYEYNSTYSTIDKELILIWAFDLDTIVFKVPVKKEKKGKGRVIGKMPSPLFSTKVMSHLTLGKVLYSKMHLDKDSLFEFNTSISEKEISIKGRVALDFRQGNGKLHEFIRQSAILYWAEQQQIAQDSINWLEKAIPRAELLLAESQRQEKNATEELAIQDKKLLIYQDQQKQINTIKTENEAISKGLAKVKNGKKISHEEKMAIAKATTKLQVAKKELGAQSQEALNAVEGILLAQNNLDRIALQTQQIKKMLSSHKSSLTAWKAKLQKSKQMAKKYLE